MPSTSSNWPPNCPPADAVDVGGDVYRVVLSNPPSADDFKSYHELDIPGGTPCRRRAISVYGTRVQACHRARMSPHLGTTVARGELEACHGKMKLTNPKSGHIEWWCAADLDCTERMTLFVEVEPC
jgi:hypothetical protein